MASKGVAAERGRMGVVSRCRASYVTLVRSPKVREIGPPPMEGALDRSNRRCFHERWRGGGRAGRKTHERGVRGSVASATMGGKCPWPKPVDPPKRSWRRETPGPPGTPGAHETRVLISKCREADVGHLASLAHGESGAHSPNEHRPAESLTRRRMQAGRTGARNPRSGNSLPPLNCVTSRDSSLVG